MATQESTALAETGSTGMDVAVGRLSELPAFNTNDPAMVFMAQIAHRWNMAKMLVRSQMIPQKTPEAAIAVMLKGHELGITPMVAFANMFFFDGKLGMSADLMTALFIQKAGGRLQVLEWTEKVCRIRFTREGWEPSEVTYTEADAQAAGLLGKANWKNRKAMLSARCRSMGVRLLAPDVFAGTYSTEELQDMGPEQPERRSSPEQLERRLSATQQTVTQAAPESVQEAQVVSEDADSPEPDALSAAIRGVATLLDDLKPAGGDASDPQRNRIRESANTLYGSSGDEWARIHALASDPNLGKRQAGALVGKLSAALVLTIPEAPATAPAPAASATEAPDPDDLFR